MKEMETGSSYANSSHDRQDGRPKSVLEINDPDPCKGGLEFAPLTSSRISVKDEACNRETKSDIENRKIMAPFEETSAASCDKTSTPACSMDTSNCPLRDTAVDLTVNTSAIRGRQSQVTKGSSIAPSVNTARAMALSLPSPPPDQEATDEPNSSASGILECVTQCLSDILGKVQQEISVKSGSSGKLQDGAGRDDGSPGKCGAMKINPPCVQKNSPLCSEEGSSFETTNFLSEIENLNTSNQNIMETAKENLSVFRNPVPNAATLYSQDNANHDDRGGVRSNIMKLEHENKPSASPLCLNESRSNITAPPGSNLPSKKTFPKLPHKPKRKIEAIIQNLKVQKSLTAQFSIFDRIDSGVDAKSPLTGRTIRDILDQSLSNTSSLSMGLDQKDRSTSGNSSAECPGVKQATGGSLHTTSQSVRVDHSGECVLKKASEETGLLPVVVPACDNEVVPGGVLGVDKVFASAEEPWSVEKNPTDSTERQGGKLSIDDDNDTTESDLKRRGENSGAKETRPVDIAFEAKHCDVSRNVSTVKTGRDSSKPCHKVTAEEFSSGFTSQCMVFSKVQLPELTEKFAPDVGSADPYTLCNEVQVPSAKKSTLHMEHKVTVERTIPAISSATSSNGVPVSKPAGREECKEETERTSAVISVGCCKEAQDLKSTEKIAHDEYRDEVKGTKFAVVECCKEVVKSTEKPTQWEDCRDEVEGTKSVVTNTACCKEERVSQSVQKLTPNKECRDGAEGIELAVSNSALYKELLVLKSTKQSALQKGHMSGVTKSVDHEGLPMLRDDCTLHEKHEAVVEITSVTHCKEALVSMSTDESPPQECRNRAQEANLSVSSATCNEEVLAFKLKDQSVSHNKCRDASEGTHAAVSSCEEIVSHNECRDASEGTHAAVSNCEEIVSHNECRDASEGTHAAVSNCEEIVSHNECRDASEGTQAAVSNCEEIVSHNECRDASEGTQAAVSNCEEIVSHNECRDASEGTHAAVSNCEEIVSHNECRDASEGTHAAVSNCEEIVSQNKCRDASEGTHAAISNCEEMLRSTVMESRDVVEVAESEVDSATCYKEKFTSRPVTCGKEDRLVASKESVIEQHCLSDVILAPSVPNVPQPVKYQSGNMDTHSVGKESDLEQLASKCLNELYSKSVDLCDNVDENIHKDSSCSNSELITISQHSVGLCKDDVSAESTSPQSVVSLNGQFHLQELSCDEADKKLVLGSEPKDRSSVGILMTPGSEEESTSAYCGSKVSIFETVLRNETDSQAVIEESCLAVVSGALILPKVSCDQESVGDVVVSKCKEPEWNVGVHRNLQYVKDQTKCNDTVSSVALKDSNSVLDGASESQDSRFDDTLSSMLEDISSDSFDYDELDEDTDLTKPKVTNELNKTTGMKVSIPVELNKNSDDDDNKASVIGKSFRDSELRSMSVTNDGIEDSQLSRISVTETSASIEDVSNTSILDATTENIVLGEVNVINEIEKYGELSRMSIISESDLDDEPSRKISLSETVTSVELNEMSFIDLTDKDSELRTSSMIQLNKDIKTNRSSIIDEPVKNSELEIHCIDESDKNRELCETSVTNEPHEDIELDISEHELGSVSIVSEPVKYNELDSISINSEPAIKIDTSILIVVDKPVPELCRLNVSDDSVKDIGISETSTADESVQGSRISNVDESGESSLLDKTSVTKDIDSQDGNVECAEESNVDNSEDSRVKCVKLLKELVPTVPSRRDSSSSSSSTALSPVPCLPCRLPLTKVSEALESCTKAPRKSIETADDPENSTSSLVVKESRPSTLDITVIATDMDNMSHSSPTKLTTPLEMCDISPDTKAVVPPVGNCNNVPPEASATSSESCSTFSALPPSKPSRAATSQSCLISPSNKFLFQVESVHYKKLSDGQRIFACDICSGVYQRKFSLKRHYLRSHINYRYLTERDISNCGIVVGDKMAVQSENNTKICMQNSKITSVQGSSGVEHSSAAASEERTSAKKSTDEGVSSAQKGDAQLKESENVIDEGGNVGESLNERVLRESGASDEDSKSKDGMHVSKTVIGLFRCHYCGLCFEEKVDLKTHLVTHSQSYPTPPSSGANADGKPFVCTPCNASFSHKQNYLRHCASLAHNNQPVVLTDSDKDKKIFLCLYCEKSFSSVAIRKRHHSRVHLNQKKQKRRKRQPHVCPYCIKPPTKFRELGFLMNHLMSVHTEIYHACTVCEERFETKAILDDHVKKGHPKVNSKSLNLKSALSSDKAVTGSVLKLTKKENKEENAVLTESLSVTQKRSQKDDGITNANSSSQKEPWVENGRSVGNKFEDNIKNDQQHNSEENFRYTCGICHKMFTNYVNMCRHNRLAHSRVTTGTKKSKHSGRSLSGLDSLSIGSTASSQSSGSRSQSPLDTSFIPVGTKKSSPSRSQASPHHALKTENNRLMDPETLFYSTLSCNIRDNLLHHLDGKLNSQDNNQKSEEPISPSLESDSKEESSSQDSNVMFGLSSPINIQSSLQDKKDQEKTGKLQKVTTRSSSVHKVSWEKYNFPKNYDGRGGLTSYIKDMSHLDIHTQLTMRQNLQRMNSNSSDSSEDVPLSSIIREEEQLNRRVIDFPAELCLVENVNASGKQVLPERSTDLTCKPDSSSVHSSKMTKEVKSTEEIVGRVTRRKSDMELRERETTHERDTSARSNNSSRRSSTEESDPNMVVLSGEWVRPRSYICAACSARFGDLYDLEDHKYSVHPNVWCTHYEFDETAVCGAVSEERSRLGARSALPVDLCRRYLLADGALTKAQAIPPTVVSESKCTKCGRGFHALPELHRHMLECGGDTTWMLTMLVASPGAGRRNRKWRPFGSRRRRQQGRRGMKRNIPNTPVKLPQYRPRHRASDNDTIQRMIANLPAKRSTRRVIQFNEDEIKTRSQGTIHSNRLLRKRFKVSFAPTFTRQNYKSGGGRLAYSRTSLSSGAGELPSSKDKKRLKHLRRKAAVAAMLAVTGSSSTSNPKKPDGAGAVTRAQLSSGLSTGIELSVSSTQKLDGTTPNPKPKQESVVEKKVVKLGGKAVSPIKKSNKSSLVNSTSTVETEDDKTSPGKSLSLARGRSTKRLCTVAEIRSSSTGSNSKIEKIKKNVKRSVSLDQKKVTKKFISTNSPITVSSPPESNAIGVKKKIGKSLGITKSKSSGSKTRSGSSPANAIPNVTDSEVPVENHNEATVDVVTVNENETSNILAAMRLAMMESTKTAKKPYTTEDVSKNKPSSVKRTRSRISVEGETAEKVTKKPKMSQVDIEERFLRNKGYVHPEDSTNEPIICESCGLQFDNGSACERHRKKCIYQKTADVLSSTIGENEDNDDQLCHHCGKSFSYAAMFWKHIKTCSPAMSFDVNNKTINKQISDKQLESPPKQDTGKETAQGVTKRSDSKSPSKKTPSKSATTDSNISPIGSDFDDKMPELEKVEPIEDVKRVTRSKKSEDLTDIPILSPVSEVDATVAENSEELFVPDPHSTLPITDKKGKRKSKAKTKLEENKITLSVEVSQSRVAPIQKGTIMMNQSEMETSLETVKEEGKPIESIKRNKSRIKNDKKENEDDKKLNSDVKKESLRKRSRSTRRSLKGSEEYALPISKLEEQFAEMVNIVDDSQELPCDKFLTENVIDNQCESTEKDAIARRRVPSRGRDCKIESQRNETEPSASGTAVSDESAETESQSSQEAPTTPKKKRNPSKVSVKKLPEPIATETHKQAVVENTLKITSSRQTHVNKKKCKIQPLKAHFSNTDPTYNELDNSMEGTKVESLPDGTADNKEYHKEDLLTHEEINYPSSSSKCTKTKKKNILRTDTINNKKITTDLSIAAIIESVVLNSSFYDESETDPVYQHYVAEHSSNKNKIKTSSTDKDNEENIELNITQALIRGEEIHQENFSKSDVLIGPLEKKRKSKRFSINSMDSNIESYETRSLTSDAAFYPEEITPQEEHVAKKNKMAITSIISTNKTAIIVNSEIPTFTSDVKVAQEDATVSSFQKNKKNKSKFSSTYSNNITLDFESYDTNLTSNAEICQEGNVSNLVRKRNSKQTKIVRTNNEENMSETCNLDVEITQEGIDDASFLKVRHSSKKLKSGVFVTNTESYETSSLTANTEIDVNISVPNLDKKSKNKRASVNNKNVTMDVTVAESDTTAPEDMAESLFIKIDQFGKKSVPKRCTVKSTESYDMLLTSSAEEDSSDMSVANLNKKVNTRKNAINKKIISTNKESGVIVSESFTQNDNVAQEDIVETSFTKIGRSGKKSLTKTFKSGTNTSDIESCEKLSLEFSAEVCQSDSSVPNLTKKSKTKKITVGSKAISKNIEDNVIISNTGAFNLDVTAVQENIILFSEIEPFGKKRLPKNSTDVGLSLESCEMTFMTSDVELCQEENDKTSVPSVYKRSTNKKTPTGKGINTSEEVDVTVPETGREETNVQKVIAKTKLIRPSGKKGKNIKSLTNILNDNSDTESSEKLSLIPDANFDLVKTFAPEIESLSRRSRTRTTFDCSDVDSDVDSTQVQSLIVNVDCYQDIAQTSPSKIKNFVKENKTHATSGDISDTEISAVVSGTPISTCGVAWNRDKLSLSKIEYLGKKVKTRKRLNKSERENIEGQIVTTEVADISLSSLSLVDKKSKTKKSALSSKNIEVCETLDANVRAVLTCGVDLESESVSVEESSVPDSTDSGVYPVTKRKRNRLPETSSVSSSPLHLETKSLRKRRHHLARQASSLDSLNGATDDSLSHDHSVEDSRSHSLSDMSRIKTLDSLESVLVGISTGIVDTDILKFGNSEMKLDDISPPTPEVTRPKRGRPKKRANLSTKATKSNETSVLELDLNESMQQGYSNINDSLENSVEDYDIDEDAIPISKLRDPVFMQNFRMRQKRDEGKAEGKLGETAEIIFNNEPNSCASPASFAAIIEMMQETTTEQVEEPEQETPFTEVVSKTENKMDEYSAKESDEKSENIQDQIVDTSKSLLSQGSKEINLGIATFIGRERSARLTRWNLSYEEMYTSSDVASETDSQEFDTAPPVEPINDLTLKKSAFVQKNGRLCGKRGRKAHLGKSKHLKLRRSSKNKKLGTNKKKGFANKVISSLRGKEQTILDPSSGLSSTSVNEDYCQQEDSKIDMHEQDSLLSKNIVHSLSGDWHTSDITIDSLTSATTDTECSNIHIDGSITSLQKQLKIKFSNKVLSQNLDQSKSEVLKLKANHDLKKKKKKKKLQVTSDEQTNSNEVTTCLNAKLPKNIKKSKLKTIEFTESNETETSTASATLTSCMDEVPAEMGQISPDFDSCLSIETKPKRKSSFGSKFYCTLCCKHYSSAYNLSKHKTSASHLIKESMVLRNSGNTGNKQVHIAGDEEKDVNLLTATQDNDMLGTETPILEGSGSKISIENVDLKCNIPLNMNMVADLKNNVTIKNESEGLTEKRSSSVTEDKVLVSQELSLKTESNPEPGCTDDAVIPLEIPAAGDARQEVVSAQTEDSAVAAVCQVPVGVAPGWSLSEESMPSNDLSLLAEDTTPINIALADNYETFSTELDTQFPVAPVPVEIGCQNWQQGQSKEQIAPEQAGDNWQNDAQVKSSGDWSSGQKGKDWTEQQTKDVTWINEQPQDPCWVDQQKVPEVNWTEQQTKDWAEQKKSKEGIWASEEQAKDGNWTQPSITWPGAGSDWSAAQPCEGPGWLWPAGAGGPGVWGPGPQLVQEPVRTVTPWVEEAEGAQYYNQLQGSSSLGSIMDSVNQILDSRTANDELPPAATLVGTFPQYPCPAVPAPPQQTTPAMAPSLQELQRAMGATDEEMAILQQLGESTLDANWPLENAEIMDLDHQDSSNGAPTEPAGSKQAVAVSTVSKQRKPPQTALKTQIRNKEPNQTSIRDSLLQEYQDKEMVCPLCHRFFLGLKALQHHVNSVHGREQTDKPPKAAVRTRKSMSSLLSTTPNEQATTGPRLLCSVCRELLQDEAALAHHKEELHNLPSSKDLRVSTIRSETKMSTEGGPVEDAEAEGLKIQMSTALGGLFDRALSNLLEKGRLSSTTKDATNCGLSQLSLLQMTIKRSVNLDRKSSEAELSTHSDLQSQPSTSTKYNTALAKKCRQELVGRRSSSASNTSRDKDDGSSDTMMERPFACPICDDRFLILSTRNRHIARAHRTVTAEDRNSVDSPLSVPASTEDPSEYPSADELDAWREASPADWCVGPTGGDAEVGSFLCSDCGINFETPQDVLKHQKLEHEPRGQTVLPAAIDAKKGGKQPPRDQQPSDHSTAAVPGHRTAELGPSSTKGVPLSSPLIAGIESGQVNKVEENARTIGSNNRKSVARECNNENVGATTTVLAIKECKMSSAVNTRRCVLIANDNETGMDTVTTKSSGKSEVPPISSTRAGSRKVAVRNAAKLVSEIEEENSDVVGLGNTAENILDNKELMVEEEEDGALETPAGQTIKDISAARRNTNNVVKSVENLSNCEAEILTAKNNANGLKGICEKVADNSVSKGNIEEMSLSSESKDLQTTKAADLEKVTEGKSGSAVSKGSPSKSPKGKLSSKGTDRPLEQCEDGDTIRAKAEAALRELNSRRGRSSAAPGAKWGLKFTVSDMPKEKVVRRDGDGELLKKALTSDRFSFPLVRKFPIGTSRFASLAEKKKKISMSTLSIKKSPPVVPGTNLPGSPIEAEVPEDVTMISGDKSAFDVYEFEDEDSAPVAELGFRTVYPRHPEDKTREADLNDMDEDGNIDLKMQECENVSISNVNKIKNEIEDQSVTTDNAKEALQNQENTDMKSGGDDVLQHLNEDEHTGADSAKLKETCDASVVEEVHHTHDTENKPEKLKESIKHHRKNKIKNSHDKTNHQLFDDEYISSGEKKVALEDCNITLMNENSIDNSIEVLVKKSKKDRSKKEHKKRKSSHSKSDRSDHNDDQFIVERDTSSKRRSKTKKEVRTLEDNKVLNGNNMDRVSNRDIGETEVKSVCDTAGRKESKKHTKKRLLSGGNSSDECDDNISLELSRKTSSKHEHSKKKHKKRKQRFSFGTEMSLGHASDNHITRYDSDDGITKCSRAVKGKRKHFDDEEDNVSSDRAEEPSEKTKKAAARRRRTKSDLLISVFAKSKRTSMMNNSVSRSKSFLSVPPLSSGRNSSSSDEDDSFNKQISPSLSKHKSKPVTSSEVL